MPTMGLDQVAKFFQPFLLCLPILAPISGFDETKIISHKRVLVCFVAIVNKVEKVAAAREPRADRIYIGQPSFKRLARRKQEVTDVVDAVDQHHFIQLILPEK